MEVTFIANLSCTLCIVHMLKVAAWNASNYIINWQRERPELFSHLPHFTFLFNIGLLLNNELLPTASHSA